MISIPHQLELRGIHINDNVNKLSLGNSAHTPLKIFLKKAAIDFDQHHIAKTYVLADVDMKPGRVWGYMTLMSSEIILNEHQRPNEISASAKYEVFPAVKIARLAVDKNLQGKGYGQMMVQWGVSLVKEKIMPYIGCRFLVVDAKPASVFFYEKLGFELLSVYSHVEDENPPMFFDMYKNLSLT